MSGSTDRTARPVRVVLVSPGDVAKERAVAKRVVDELNRGVAADRLSLWRWETDARPGMHREGPQGLIDELMDIQDADVVVGVLWKRFGTPTHGADSGTEHELRRAWDAWTEHGRPDVMVYFCTRPYSPGAPDELVQWRRVLEFKRELPGPQLSWRYESVGQFEALLREHLTRYLLRSRPAPAPSPARSAKRRVRFNLPPVAASFTGREEELAALDKAFGAAERAVITQAITGLGGVGKSQLAARYAQTRADGYDVVAWIRAEDGGIPDLAQLAGMLGEPVEGGPPSEAAQLALDRLSDSAQRWLLVLDNVESADQLQGLLPRSGIGRVLVTSRDRELRQFGAVLAADVFDEDTATAYLTDRAGRPDDRQAAGALARALGCLPLALSHAAAYCQSGTSFADYLKLLGGLPARELFASHPELSYARTVASTWRTSIQAASNGAPLAGDVLEMAAYLAPDAIPKSLFTVLVENTPAGRNRLSLAFNALARFSLATVDDDSVSVHRLLQKTVRDDSVTSDDHSAARNALRSVDEAFASRDDTALPALWPCCERLLPHVMALADTPTASGDSAVRLIDVLNRACRYLYHAGGGERAVTAAETAAGHAERLLDPEHVHTLRSRNNLANAYQGARRTREAIAI